MPRAWRRATGSKVEQSQIAEFGFAPCGAQVHRVVLRSAQLEVGILTLGAILNSVHLAGVSHSLVVGFDRAEGYGGNNIYCGAVVGPVAGRLRGAEAMIAGQLWRFLPNDGGQVLHGGTLGMHQRLWQIADLGAAHVTLTLELAHCEGGFPGKRKFEARYCVTENKLMLDLVSRTDRPTLANLAPHAYWNLSGGKTLAGHRLRVAADHVLPVGPELYPIAGPEPVTGRLDLRQGQRLGQPPGYDQCFCLSQTRQPIRPVACLDLPEGQGAPGLELSTTETGLQVHDGASHAAHPFFGVALESQSWPDAPNHAGYPSILLDAGDGALTQSTCWKLNSTSDTGK